MVRAFKIITAGDGGVGKTTLLNRYINNKFIENLQMTIGVQFFKKDFEISSEKFQIIIWDFGGQEQFHEILTSYIPGAAGALLMFDLSDVARTLRNFEMWWSMLNSKDKIPIILIGAKADLMTEDDNSLDEKEIDGIRKKYKFIDYIETSSKTGQNVTIAVETLIKKAVELRIKTT